MRTSKRWPGQMRGTLRTGAAERGCFQLTTPCCSTAMKSTVKREYCVPEREGGPVASDKHAIGCGQRRIRRLEIQSAYPLPGVLGTCRMPRAPTRDRVLVGGLYRKWIRRTRTRYARHHISYQP
jgi:hypothetical protein